MICRSKQENVRNPQASEIAENRQLFSDDDEIFEILKEFARNMDPPKSVMCDIVNFRRS